jgi:hypothetical protein
MPPPVETQPPVLQQRPVEPPPRPVEAPPQPPPKPAYSGPRSGLINWSGTLEKDGTVTIEGTHATSGSLSGGLPGVPVIIELDPREYAIVEAPAPSNGWKRLTVRSRKKRNAVVPIRWTVIQ